jgi:trigger factor
VAGKLATFALTIKEVAQPNIPALDASFATAFGIKSGKVEDLRSEVEANLKLELKRKLEGLLKDQAMKGLREKTQLTLPKSLVDLEAVQLMRRMGANLEQQGMKAEDIKLTPDLFRPQAEERVALGLILGELVRTEGLQAKPEQVMSMVKDVAQTYEQPEAVIRWHFEKPERLADFEGLAVERNVVDWVLGKAQVKDVPSTFEALMAPAQQA